MSLASRIAFSLIDIKKIKPDNEGIRRKRANEEISKRDTLVKKAYELGEIDGVKVALIVCKNGRYTVYSSQNHKTWPPAIAEIQNTYPVPKIMLPEDVETRLSKCRRRMKLSQKEKGGERVMDDE